jgi:hypothetical protein
MNLETAKRTDPWISASHPDFKWTSGADVQATWRKHGWTPPSESITPPPPPPVKEPVFIALRRFK